MTAVVDEAIQSVDQVVAWLAADTGGPGGRRYPWSRAEETELRRWYGRLSRPDLAARITAILQQRTGDPNAERTVAAVACRAQQIGLKPYNGEPDELYLKAAADFVGLDYTLLHKAARSGELPTRRRGKKRYVKKQALSCWFVAYRDRLQTRGDLLDALDGLELVDKAAAMRLAGLAETHLTRYLKTGVIRAWKVPDLSRGDRGEWLVLKPSVEDYVRARNEGRLQEYLNQHRPYVRLRKTLARQIQKLRQAGRLNRAEDLTEPRSKSHPGCFTVAQVAAHLGLSAQRVYQDIKSGHLDAVQVKIKVGGRPSYAVPPGPARAYVARARERAKKRDDYEYKRDLIKQAGLLTIRDLSKRWGITENRVYDYVRHGHKGISLPSRKWGLYRVFEPADVEAFERQITTGANL